MSPINDAFILSVFKNMYSYKLSLYVRYFHDGKFEINVEKTRDSISYILERMFIWTLRLLTLIGLYVIMCTIALAEFHGDHRPVNQTFSMVDIGFTLTQNLHHYLRFHQTIHHWLAFLNTLGIDIILVYTVLVIGYWQRRPGIVVVETTMFLLRLACGWLTQLPYSNEYLASEHDFPDCLTNRFRDATSLSDQRQHASFFFFFSGHVALVSLVAVYFNQTNRRWSSYACNLFNVLQMVRLLATRGHYTIDLIGGVLIGSYAYSFVADVDKYLASCKFIGHLLRKRDMKMN